MQNIYSSFAFNHQNWKQLDVPQLGNGQTVVRPYNGIPLNNKKKQTIKTHKIDESQIHTPK